MSDPNVYAGRRILVVEDDYFIANAMARSLEARGATIIGPAPSIEQALALIAETDVITAAVLDIDLRGEMAYPVAEELRAREVPFIFTTGYDRLAVDPRFADVPRYEKPLDFDRVAQALFV